MSWIEDKDYYQTFARKIEPHVILMTTDCWIGKIAAIFGVIVTFGIFKYKDFLEHTAFAAGPILCFPRRLETLDLARVVHECQHARQMRWCGCGISPWVGVLPFMILYLLIFFPVKFAPFRYLFELNAAIAAWKYLLANGVKGDVITDLAQKFAKRVGGKTYFWAWPKKWVEKGFQKAAIKTLLRD